MPEVPTWAGPPQSAAAEQRSAAAHDGFDSERRMLTSSIVAEC
jgi:hypothetical protein